MAAPTKRAKKASPAPAPVRVSVAGEPVGKWAKILAETPLSIDPFDVTEDLVIYPPTREQMHALDVASTAHMAAQIALTQVLQEGPPQQPLLPEQPTPEDYEQYKSDYTEWAQRREGWVSQHQRDVDECKAQCNTAETAYNHALFGGEDVYDRVNDYFRGKPDWQQRAFEVGVKAHFLRLPTDGKCQLCGQVVDPKAHATANGSSTTSSTTGTNSNPTSAPSTTSTPETGPAA